MTGAILDPLSRCVKEIVLIAWIIIAEWGEEAFLTFLVDDQEIFVRCLCFFDSICGTRTHSIIECHNTICAGDDTRVALFADCGIRCVRSHSRAVDEALHADHACCRLSPRVDSLRATTDDDCGRR